MQVQRIQSNNNYNTNFGARIKIIKEGDKMMHYGPINYLGLMDYFKQGFKPLSKEAQAKKLDIVLGSDNTLTPYENGFYDINVYVGKARDLYATVNVGGGVGAITGPHASVDGTKQNIDLLFNHIKTYIDKN